MLFEQAVHHIDLWRYLLSEEVEEVFALTRSDDWDDVSATVTARMSNGSVVSSVFCERTSAANQVKVSGDKGSVLVSCYRFAGLQYEPVSTVPGSIADRMKNALRFVRELSGAISTARKGGIHQLTFVEEWRSFLGAVLNGGSVRASLEDGRRAVEVVLAAMQSAETGRPVRMAEAPGTVTPVARG